MDGFIDPLALRAAFALNASSSARRFAHDLHLRPVHQLQFGSGNCCAGNQRLAVTGVVTLALRH